MEYLMRSAAAEACAKCCSNCRQLKGQHMLGNQAHSMQQSQPSWVLQGTGCCSCGCPAGLVPSARGPESIAPQLR